MRVSTRNIYLHTKRMINRTSINLNKSQEVLTTGKKINRPSDDPATVATLIQLEAVLAGNEKMLSNNMFAQYILNFQESTLDLMNDTLSSVIEDYIIGYNDTTSFDEKKYMAQLLSAGAKTIADLINTKNENGYIFNGSKTNTPPVSVIENITPVLEGTQLMHSGKPITLILPGTIEGEGTDFKLDYVTGKVIEGELPDDITISFITENELNSNVNEIRLTSSSSVKAGVTYSDYKGIIDAIVLSGQSLINGDPESTIDVLKEASNKLIKAMTEVGANLNYTKNTHDYISEHTIVVKDRISKLEDINYPEAVNEYNQNKLIRDVTLRTIPKLVQPTLIDFLV